VLGPALGGVTISGFGIVAPFWINAISNLGIVGALLWWRECRRASDSERRRVVGVARHLDRGWRRKPF
jgi:hypothetical protein